MPWSPSDGPARHTKKATTPAKRKQWNEIAMKGMKAWLADGLKAIGAK